MLVDTRGVNIVGLKVGLLVAAVGSREGLLVE